MDEAAIYLRLSKEDLQKQGDFSESINNQRLMLTNYCLEQGFSVAKVYCDDDYSGLYDSRPGFNELMKDAKLGRFNVIVAKSQSRFTRNMEHVEKYIHHDLPLLGIRFIGAVDGVDTNVKGNKKARQIYGLTNEWYCEDLSENIRATFREKMKAGEFLGGFAPYGYSKDANDKHQLVVDPYASVVVQKIYQLFLEGYGIQTICHMLEDMGIDSPSGYKAKNGMKLYNPAVYQFSRPYNYWPQTTVKRILEDETYVGKLVQHRAQKISYKDKKVVAVPREEWIVVENHHEPIVDQETFQKVTDLKKRRRIPYIDQEIAVVHKFAGKLRCGTCGATMIKSGGVRNDKNDWYLRCQLANKSRKTKCTSHNIRYKVVEEYVLREIQSIVNGVLVDANEREKLGDFLAGLSCAEQKMKILEKTLCGLKREINTRNSIIKLLYTDRVENKIAEELFFQIKEENEHMLQGLWKKRKDTENELKSLKLQKSGVLDRDKLVKKYCDYSQLNHAMAADFIDYIEIGERDKDINTQEIRIHWNF